ncbi:aminoglycoside phosphotransferase family protein [Streptomyces pactum]|uniref:Aminoglycoside phosphotransferase family protein n=1 Tax=Streptomyces pactum TaxID=68249 RepID=A0ABS0NRR5_9ACTN|nr:aminoglycoside phosphotransferase family protein [Streptomyces pactum]MBH5337912.1 aminoglycoside phosphotransferase family protein [Streptomyces pactum]
MNPAAGGPSGEPDALVARIRAAAHPGAAGILLPPLTVEVGTLSAAPPATPAPVPPAGPLAGPVRVPPPAGSSPDVPVPSGDRAVTLWPYGRPVSPDRPEDAPWEAAGHLLARLHRLRPAGLPGPLPVMRGPAKAARAVARLLAAAPGTPAAAVILRAWAGLPAWARDEAPMPRTDIVCHGDMHLGQLVRYPAPDGPWLLIDVDDLGVGEPAWDLARPAAWYATGLVGEAEWSRFLAAYRAAGGPAVRPGGDPWPELDAPARALTVQSAATGVAKAAAAGRELDGAEEAMVDACARIARLGVPVVG